MLFLPGYRWMVALAASGWLFAGCQTRSPAARSEGENAGSTLAAARSEGLNNLEGDPALSPSEIRDSQSDTLVEAHAHYGTALIHEMNGEAVEALNEYYQAASRDLTNESLILEVSRGLIQAKQPEKALELLLRATAQPKASGTLFARLGFVYFVLGKQDLAISANRTAIRRDSRSLVGYQNLFLIYLQTKKPSDAVAVLDLAGKTTGAPPEYLIGLGELYANFALQNASQRDAVHARGVAALRRVEKGKLVDRQLHLRLADAFNMLGQEDEAAQIYQELLRQLRDIPEVRDGVRAKLTEIYLRDHDHKRAIEQLEGMVRENPTDPQPYYSLGSIAYSDTNYVQAAEYFSKVVLLEPNFEQAYYDLAGAQISADQPAEALVTLEKARTKFPQKFFGEYLTGMAYERQKDFTNAVNHFTTAEIIAQVRDAKQLRDSFYFQLGAASERKGDYAQAEKYFEKCLELSPNFSEAQNYLGFMLADRGEQLERARELIDRALKAEPKNAAFLDSMGWVLFKLNKPKDALTYLLEAVKNSEEEDATLYDHLGDIYSVLQRPDKALEAWRKSLAIEENKAVRKKLETLSRS
jgi:tetratricopeptide (TPR) repeat protein